MILEKKQFKKEIFKMLIKMLVVLVIAISLCFFLVRMINQKSKSLVEKRILMLTLQEKRERVVPLKEGYKKIEPYLEKVRDALPSKDNLSPFISALEILAEETGTQQTLYFKRIDSCPVGEVTLNKVSYEIKLWGNYQSFLNYLLKLEKLPYFIKINHFELIGLEGLDNPSRMEISAEVYAK